MLTYENKRALLESYLCENLIREENECECVCYAWVCDLDDVYVYFEFDGKYYRATYTIIAENEETYVSIDVDNKEQVVRSWSTFEAENDSVCETENTSEVFEENTDGNENEFEEEVNDCQKEQHEEDSDEKDDKQDSEFAITESVVETSQETFVEAIDLNNEPDDVNTETPTTEEIIEESTASIVAPEVQTEVENLGDANNQAAEVLGEEVEEVIADDNLNGISLEVSEGPDGQTATVVEIEDEDAS